MRNQRPQKPYILTQRFAILLLLTTTAGDLQARSSCYVDDILHFILVWACLSPWSVSHGAGGLNSPLSHRFVLLQASVAQWTSGAVHILLELGKTHQWLCPSLHRHKKRTCVKSYTQISNIWVHISGRAADGWHCFCSPTADTCHTWGFC